MCGACCACCWRLWCCGECGGGGECGAYVALVSAACRAMARCGARRLARLGCRRARARWIGARSLGQGASLRRKRWCCGRVPWVWCGVGERGLESDGALRGTSGRGAVMRARGIIGPMRDALGADGGGRDDRRRDGGDLCSMTRKQEMSQAGAGRGLTDGCAREVWMSRCIACDEASYH